MKKTTLLLVGILLSLPAFCQSDINYQMVLVKGGNFFMGSDDHHYLDVKYDNEKPMHRVGVSNFYMGKYEVTQGQWRAIMGMNPPSYNGAAYANKDCNDCPVVKVNYEEVLEFIARLNKKYPDKHYRLPTETEWEYAARGGKYSKNFKYAGSDKLSEVGWAGHRNGSAFPVGEKEPNELSIYDMSGNVMEWCSDWYGADYYKGTLDQTDLKGPAKGELRVLRGGSFSEKEDMCRSVARNRISPKSSHWDLGFRLAMDATETTAK